MNISIIIDATSQFTHLHLILNKNELLETTTYTNNNDLSYMLSKYISKMLIDNAFKKNNLKQIYLVYGPGKFSAMRICTTVSKTWSLLLGADLYIIDRFDYYSNDNCICVLKSDGNKSFVLEYQNGNRVGEPLLMKNDDLNSFIENHDQSDFVYESSNETKVIEKLPLFKKVDEDFELKYLRAAC
ncbi:MAG: hypothetical protein ACRC4L_03945 [Mycoplasma sp.]